MRVIHPAERSAQPLPAFILGVEHPRGIACVRSLAQRGIPVVSVDFRLSSSAAPYTSRYIGKRAVIDPSTANAVESLEALAGKSGGVLIPTNDEYLLFVARNHERLSRTFSIGCPDWNQLEPAMDRMRSTAIAERAGLLTARTFDPKDAVGLEETLEKLDFATCRYVLKLELWDDTVADTRLGRKTTYGGADRDKLRSRVLEIAERTGAFPIIQELVPGETDMSLGVTLVVDHSGEIRVAYCVRRLKLQTYSEVSDFRHPYDLGGNVFCESVHDPDAMDQAIRFVRAIGWYGTITVEFRRDMRDGSLRFVKIDPRVIRSTTLSRVLGMDVPSAVYDVALDQMKPASDTLEYPSGVCWIWLDNYFESLWRNRRYTSVRRELFGLVRRFPDVRAFAYWSWRDPLPFFTQVALRLTFARRWLQPKRFTELTGLKVGASPPSVRAFLRRQSQ